MALAPSAPVTPEQNLNPEASLTVAPDDTALEADGFLANYLDGCIGEGRDFAPHREQPVLNGSLLAFGKFQAGYGKIFNDDFVTTWGRSGTAREEASCLFLKISFRF